MAIYERHDYFAACDCMCHDHIIYMCFFPPREEFPVEDEDMEIYATICQNNYYDRICPPILGILSPYDWGCFFRYHFFRRFAAGLKYIFNKSYIRKWGLGAGDVDDKYLDGMYDFLNHIAKDEYVGPVEQDFDVWLEANRYEIRFTIDKIDDDFPYQLGWEIQFPRKQNVFKRIVSAWRYVWGLDCNERCGTIEINDAKEIKAMIRWIQNRNKTDAEKDEVPQPEDKQV